MRGRRRTPRYYFCRAPAYWFATNRIVRSARERATASASRRSSGSRPFRVVNRTRVRGVLAQGRARAIGPAILDVTHRHPVAPGWRWHGCRAGARKASGGAVRVGRADRLMSGRGRWRRLLLVPGLWVGARFAVESLGAEGSVVSWDWLARRAGHAPGPSASRNLAMIGPLTGPPSAPPVFWVTIANAMSPS
jgi:hypothetical protein